MYTIAALDGAAELASDGLTGAGAIVVQHRKADGTVTQTVDVGAKDSGR